MAKEVDNYVWERVPEDHPHRCQAVNKNGQCRNISVEGSSFCLAHGGNKAAEAAEKIRMKNYRLSKFKERASQLSDSTGIESLRDEVAILRMLIEERINKCQDTTDLLLVSGPLSDLVLKVERVVSSMNKLEGNLGKHIDKSRLIQFSKIMIEIITKYVTNPEVLDAIGEDFFKALEEV